MTFQSYKIHVKFHADASTGHTAATHLYVNAGTPDLAVLLHALDSSPAVASVSVFSTLTVPDLYTHGKLTAEDLGMPDLRKLR